MTIKNQVLNFEPSKIECSMNKESCDILDDASLILNILVDEMESKDCSHLIVGEGVSYSAIEIADVISLLEDLQTIYEIY